LFAYSLCKKSNLFCVLIEIDVFIHFYSEIKFVLFVFGVNFLQVVSAKKQKTSVINEMNTGFYKADTFLVIQLN
jgi:hypothetical protein